MLRPSCVVDAPRKQIDGGPYEREHAARGYCRCPIVRRRSCPVCCHATSCVEACPDFCNFRPTAEAAARSGCAHAPGGECVHHRQDSMQKMMCETGISCSRQDPLLPQTYRSGPLMNSENVSGCVFSVGGCGRRLGPPPSNSCSPREEARFALMPDFCNSEIVA